MRLQPRQQLLDIWKAVARYSYDKEHWTWGGRDGRGSITDAEQLLCIMYPASALPSFRLDRPDGTTDDVVATLRALGGATDIPRRLIRVLTEYMNTYLDDSGAPVFSGGNYFRTDAEEKITEEQRSLDVVDSFSMSVTLTLATIGFLRVFKTQLTRPELQTEAETLEKLASTRLTAAMVGLLRSFAVNVFDPASPPGRTLLRTVNRGADPTALVTRDLQDTLAEIRAGLRDLTIGSGQVDFDNPDMLFECGWSWGIVEQAPEVDTGDEEVGGQPPGIAEKRPYLYFTVVALDGIADLFSERTRVLGLLNDDQQSLANALQRRWELTRRYWAEVASFGKGSVWPLEDIPWRTSDADESDYYSLLVTSLVAQDLDRRRIGDPDLARVHRVLEELAGRGRITRRALTNDPAIELHSPGVSLGLVGSERLGPQLTWVASDFAVMLLKRAVMVALQARSTELRGQLLTLADDTWTHLYRRRRDDDGSGSLWDDPTQVFRLPAPGSAVDAPAAEVKSALNPPTETDSDLEVTKPSWYFTERVVEALVQVAILATSQPPRSQRLGDHAADLLAEAEQLFDQERLSGSMEAGPSMQTSMKLVRANLLRAREILSIRPGTAAALALKVLRDLDRLDMARNDRSGIG
jgi:hypothetical protein